MPDPTTVEEVTTAAGLEALEAEWWALWDRCAGATPFQSPAWLLPWWRRFGAGELLTLAIRRDGRLTGLAPLYVLDDGAERKLLPLGIGPTDYLDPLLEAADGAAVLAHLAALAPRFDRMDLMDQRPGSPFLDAPTPPGWRSSVAERAPCPTLTWPAGSLAGAVPRLAKQLYYQRRADRLGTASWVAADGNSLDAMLDALFELHAARWATRGRPGMLAEEAVQRFHREAARGLLGAGLLRLMGLRIDGRFVAVFYGFADRRRLHAYLSGYDPAVPHPGLGAMLIGHAIERADAEGLREFHFLRGGEPYKHAWGALDRPLLGRSLRK